MRRAMIALLSAGAVALAGGGYAIGAVSHHGAAKPSAVCEQAEQEFASRADQLRKQMQRPRQLGLDDSKRTTVEAAHSRILAEVVQQNPTCFGAGMRAAAAVIQQHRSEGEADVAICDLTGVKVEACLVAVG